MSAVRSSQALQLFEFPALVGGCGETPYIKWSHKLSRPHVFANATWMFSIYRGNLLLPLTAKIMKTEGPAWSNSLFETNARNVRLGFRRPSDQQKQFACELVKKLEY